MLGFIAFDSGKKSLEIPNEGGQIINPAKTIEFVFAASRNFNRKLTPKAALAIFDLIKKKYNVKYIAGNVRRKHKKEKFIAEHNVEMNFTIPKPFKDSKTASYNRYDDGSKMVTNSNDIFVQGQNFFSGWNCSVGDAIFISPVGNVSLASCGQGDSVGHILDDISKVGPLEITCNKSHCHCGTDIIIPKFTLSK